MKKKIKLISTFASLGLALALMVFGVYAATSASFKVTTEVSFTATKHVQATVVAKETAKLAAAPEDDDYTVDAKTNPTQTIGVKADGTDEGALANVVFTGVTLDATNKYYGYQITITNNDDENALPVVITAADKTAAQYKVTFENEDATSIPASGKLIITMVLEITDLAGNNVTVAPADLEMTVALGA